MSPNNSNVTLQADAKALRFNLQGELLLRQFADGAADVKEESVESLLQQGRITSEQLRQIGVVWVPTSQLVIAQVVLPGSRQSELRAALPYALEEQLSDAVENYHFVILHKQPAQEGTQLQVAVIAKVLMNQWYQALKRLELDNSLLNADCFALPEPETEVSVAMALPEAPVVIYRDGRYSGFAIPETLSEQLASSSKEVRNLTPQQAQWQKIAFSPSAWQQLQSTNLAVGEFALKESQNLWRQWLWPNLAAGLLFVVLLGSNWLEKEQALQDAQVYRSQSEQLFKAMFPDVKRVVSIKTQTMTRLRAPSQDVTGARLMPLVYQLEPVLSGQTKVRIDELNWQRQAQGGKLSLRLTAKQSGDLQKLQQQIQQRAGKLQAQLSIKNVTPEMALGELNVVAN